MSEDRASRWIGRIKTLVALVLSLQLLAFSGGLVGASAQEVPSSPSPTDSPTPPPSLDPSPVQSANATILVTTASTIALTSFKYLNRVDR